MKKPKPIYMETTEMSVDRTAGEISALLVAAGARQIQMDYGDDGAVTAMRFTLLVHGLPYPFRLPVRVEAMQRIFKQRRVQTMKWKASNFEAKDNEQAARVGWRQVYKWLQAQLALAQTGMVQVHEIFAPYLLEPSGRTLFEYLEATRFKELPPGKEA